MVVAGFGSVLQEIQQDLLHLVVVDVDVGQTGVVVADEAQLRVGGVGSKEGEGGFQDAVDVVRAQGGRWVPFKVVSRWFKRSTCAMMRSR